MTTEGEYEYDCITQEIADWANGYLNNFTTKIVIDKDKIRIGELEYTYGTTFSYDIDENGELYDEHYLFLVSQEGDTMLISATYRYGQDDMQFVHITFDTSKYFGENEYRIRIYVSINKIRAN